MDCKNARMVLAVAHPLATELDARDRADLARHLAECPDCGPWAEAECLLDECIGKVIRAVPVPAGLAQRLERRLNADRDAWFRVWAVRASGIAASLLVAAWLGWVFWWGIKPAPNLVGLSEDANQELRSAEQVEQAFKERGVDMIAPPQFDYRFLREWQMVQFQGKIVPSLLFCAPGNNLQQPMARVYVLSDQEFNISDVAKAAVPPGSHRSIVVLPHLTSSHVVYVVDHPAGIHLTLFFKGPKA
jgi:hypothetical protein